jgi:hypothetical protein
LAAQRSAVLTVVALPTLKLVATLAWETIFLQVSPAGTVGFAMTCEGVQAGLVLVVVVVAFVLVLLALVALGVVLGVVEELLALVALGIVLGVVVEELLALLVLTLVLEVVSALEPTALFGDTVVLEEGVVVELLVDVLEITVVMELVLEDSGTKAGTDPFADPLPPDRPFAPVFRPLPVVPVPEPTP